MFLNDFTQHRIKMISTSGGTLGVGYLKVAVSAKHRGQSAQCRQEATACMSHSGALDGVTPTAAAF